MLLQSHPSYSFLVTIMELPSQCPMVCVVCFIWTAVLGECKYNRWKRREWERGSYGGLSGEHRKPLGLCCGLENEDRSLETVGWKRNLLVFLWNGFFWQPQSLRNLWTRKAKGRGDALVIKKENRTGLINGWHVLPRPQLGGFGCKNFCWKGLRMRKEKEKKVVALKLQPIGWL